MIFSYITVFTVVTEAKYATATVVLYIETCAEMELQLHDAAFGRSLQSFHQ